MPSGKGDGREIKWLFKITSWQSFRFSAEFLDVSPPPPPTITGFWDTYLRSPHFLPTPGNMWDPLVAIIDDGLCDQGYQFTSSWFKTKEDTYIFCFLPSLLQQYSSGKALKSWSFKNFSSSISFQPCKHDFPCKGGWEWRKFFFKGKICLSWSWNCALRAAESGCS